MSSNSKHNLVLDGKVAVVTGGGRGIGRAVAQTLAAAGARVAVIARSGDEIEETAALIKQAGGTAHAFSADVSVAAPVYPEHASESWPVPPSPADTREWDRMRRQTGVLLGEFRALAQWSPEELDRQIESMHAPHTKLAGTLEAVLWQVVAHNSYHVGQIAMLRKALGAWPPREDGDTW